MARERERERGGERESKQASASEFSLTRNYLRNDNPGLSSAIVVSKSKFVVFSTWSTNQPIVRISYCKVRKQI